MSSASDEEFVTFVRSASPQLLRTAWFICGDPVQAEELVQSALEKVYIRWRRIDHGTATAYARRAVLNHHIDTQRHRSREVLTDRTPESATTDHDVAETDALMRALSTLAPRERQVVVLRHYSGLSEQEVAAVLGTGLGTVKSSGSRGLAKLRDLLVREGENHA